MSSEKALTGVTAALSSNPTVGLWLERPVAANAGDLYADAGRIGHAIAQAVTRSGLGEGDLKRPFAGIIKQGQSVLLKPNWVYHRNSSGTGMQCMITQHEFVLACLEAVLLERPSRVVVGDAPIQACRWEELVTSAFLEKVGRLSAERAVPVQVVDFRRTILLSSDFTEVRKSARPEQEYILFDLGRDSVLDPVAFGEDRFRVTCYDHRELAKTHRPGRHQYLLCREAFDADVILSLPKPKTHRKAGLTGAMKNLVGLNGSKEYLPHHRRGGTSDKGDCYPGRSILRRVGEFFYDTANQRIGRKSFGFWNTLGAVAGHFVPDKEGGMEGSWHGNDTCWRMVLDLNRIALYGRSDGTMADVPQRSIYSLADAIVCGQGEGPLCPEPLAVQAVTFSNSAPHADAVHATLMGLDYRKLAVIREAFGDFRWPLVGHDLREIMAVADRRMTISELAEFCVAAKPPAGWAGHVELPPEVTSRSN